MVTSVCLQTPLTELYNDLGDVVRLFFGEVSVSAEKGIFASFTAWMSWGILSALGNAAQDGP